MKLPIIQVDAFASGPFTGNPAAVIPLEAWVEDDLMQKIAMENNLSETAYLVRDEARGEGHYGLRWFTPGVEVDLCGHATLASAHVLWNELGEEAETLTFATRSGDLLVRQAADGLIQMDFPTNRQEATVDGSGFEKLLGVTPDIVFSDSYVMAVLPTEEAVRSFELKVADIAEVVAPKNAALIVTGPGSGDIDCVSRFFAPYADIDEDPVTGSIHTAIVPYWADRLGKKDIVAFQASPRGGTLYCTDAGERVIIRGKCADYMKGHVEIDN